MSERFYFIANNLALDFINTLIADEKGEPLELLKSVKDLKDWQSAAGLRGEKQRDVETDETGLDERAFAFRDHLKVMARSVAEGKQIPSTAIKAINDVLSRSKGHFELSTSQTGYATTFKTDVNGSRDPLLPIAESAAELLSEGNLSLVRKCQRDGCVLYFYDTSKRHGRQWCTMSVCGNRSKAAAHYRRSHSR
jgi:predicted RNA-binding Zn ribbon-like protein